MTQGFIGHLKKLMQSVLSLSDGMESEQKRCSSQLSSQLSIEKA